MAQWLFEKVIFKNILRMMQIDIVSRDTIHLYLPLDPKEHLGSHLLVHTGHSNCDHNSFKYVSH